MNSLVDAANSFLDVLKAEWAVARFTLLRVAMGLALLIVASIMLVAAMYLLLAGVFLLLASAAGMPPPLAALATAGVALGLAYGTLQAARGMLR